MNFTKFFITVIISIIAFSAKAMPTLSTGYPTFTATNFNSFENMPIDLYGNYFNSLNPYTEDGITVQEIHGGPIWALNSTYAQDGMRAWQTSYDFGYTQITLANGNSISDLSLLFVPFNYGDMAYELLNKGQLVLSGTLTAAWGDFGRIGFTGGGFDEVRLRSGELGSGVANGVAQQMSIDGIQIVAAESEPFNNIPEPPSLALVTLAIVGLMISRRRNVT